MISLYDSEVLAIEKGPLAWMQSKQRSRMPLEDFRRGAIEQFHKIGLKADVRAYTTDEQGTYAFDVQIEGRIEKREFDYDRMTHEVVNNLLELPDQAGGVIKADAELARMERKRQMGMLPKHKH